MKKRRIAEIILAGLIAIFSFYHLFSWINLPLLFITLVKTQIHMTPNVFAKQIPAAHIQGFHESPVSIRIPSMYITMQIAMSKNPFSFSSTYANILHDTSYPNPVSGNVILFISKRNAYAQPLEKITKDTIIELYTKSRVFVYEIYSAKAITDSNELISNIGYFPTISIALFDHDFSQSTYMASGKLLYYQNIHK